VGSKEGRELGEPFEAERALLWCSSPHLVLEAVRPVLVYRVADYQPTKPLREVLRLDYRHFSSLVPTSVVGGHLFHLEDQFPKLPGS
jgi:hypothetical protein